MRQFSFQWHITDECDLRCRHCYLFDGRSTNTGLAAHPGALPWENMKRVVEECEQFCQTLGAQPYFHLTGGDPLLHPHFWDLLELLANKGHSVAVMGNPYYLTPRTCTRLAQLGIKRFQLSLDGLQPTHDAMREEGSYNATLQAIKRLHEAGVRVAVMSTVSAENIADIPALVDVVAQAGVDVYAFARYVPAPGGSNGIAPARYRQLLQECHAKFSAYEAAGHPTRFHRKDHLWRLFEYEEGLWRIPENANPGLVYEGCTCANAHATILANGNVLACRRVAESQVGNLLQQPLAEIWAQPMDAYRQFGKFEKCARCKLLAWCRGCPAVAAGTHGSFYSPDPQCWLS